MHRYVHPTHRTGRGPCGMACRSGHGHALRTGQFGSLLDPVLTDNSLLVVLLN